MNAFLLEPLFAEIWGVRWNIDAIPGIPTIIGSILITFAIYKYNTSILIKNSETIVP